MSYQRSDWVKNRPDVGARKIIHPMAAHSISFRAADPRHLRSVIYAGAALALIATLFANDPFAYLCVTIPVLLPSFLWVNSGAFGIPVLPTISALFYVYYALPLILGNTLTLFKPSELIWAGSSVGLFLTAASLAAWPFFGVVRSPMISPTGSRPNQYARSIRTRAANNIAVAEQLKLIFLGLAGGILFNYAFLAGYLTFLGSFSSVVRAGVMPLASVACYMMGFARGSGSLTGERWAFALCGFILLTLLSMSGLFLVGAAMNGIAILLGYVLGARRVPWAVLGCLFLVFGILNAGKGHIRDQYWAPQSQSLQNSSILKLPGMMANWFVTGLENIGSSEQTGPSLLERASLLHMVLTVQQVTPRIIPYLDGKTYEMLPAMLVPRFLQPDKIESQAALNFLSVRYGRQIAEAQSSTTIGWGLVSEAYANFGNVGVILVGAVFGVLCGFLMRLSANAAPVSLAMLITIASTLTLCDLEADFSYMMVTLFQTIVGLILFATLIKSMRRKPAPALHHAQRNLR